MEINIKSEIGNLKAVLVHRPGKEVERIYPEIFERILFDDIMHLEKAQEEHDVFTNILRKEGVKVYYIEKLVAEVLNLDPKLKKEFIKQFLDQSNVSNKSILKESKKFLESFKNNYELVAASIAGVTKDDIKPSFERTIEDMVAKDNPYPIYIDPIPNVLFQRDAMISIFSGTKINNMWAETRKREAIYTQFVYKYHPDFKDIDVFLDSDSKGAVEGGDVLVIDEQTIFVGLSQRTNSVGIQELADKLFEKYPNFKNLIAICIPISHATMHLDTVLTQIDHEKFSISFEMQKLNYEYFTITRDEIKKTNGKIIDILHKYVSKNIKFITVGGGSEIRAKREQWNDGANCLAIRPGTIVVYDRNKITNEIMRKDGINVIEIPSSELSRGRGGPRCMSMPLYREDIK